ncbi:MAG: DNRLRE domain-containing protein [Fuerstiella sp.]
MPGRLFPHAFTAVLCAACIIVPEQVTKAGVITLTATHDAQIHKVVPDTNLDNSLAIRQTQPVYTAVKFDLSGIVGPITEARVRVQWTTSNSIGVDARRFTGADWDESTVTWNSMNGGLDPILQATTVLDSASSGPGGGFTDFLITSTAQDWLSTPGDNRGLLFTANSGSSLAASFYSIQQSNLGVPAQLILTGDNIAAVPEPATLAIFGLETVGLISFRRRRRRLCKKRQ